MKNISGLALGLHPINIKTRPVDNAIYQQGPRKGALVLSEHEGKVQNRYKEKTCQSDFERCSHL